jgi:hypothetical protein
VDGAMVLRVEKVEHAGGKNKGESEDRGLFHVAVIIPRFQEGVKPTFYCKR